MTPSSLLALEGKLVEAKEGSRQLDGALWAVAHGSEWQYGDSIELPHYTSSIDAALALVSRCLPGWSWSVEQFPKLRAQLAQPIQTEFGNGIGVRAQVYDATTPALAICLALIRALQRIGE